MNNISLIFKENKRVTYNWVCEDGSKMPHLRDVVFTGNELFGIIEDFNDECEVVILKINGKVKDDINELHNHNRTLRLEVIKK
jgi:hypothetical protein